MHVAGDGSYKVAPYSSARSLHDRIIHLEWASKLKDYEFSYHGGNLEANEAVTKRETE